MKKALLLILSVLLLGPGFAQSLVIDKADVFSAAEEEQLLQRIGEVHRNNNAVLCIYTVASLAGRTIHDYSLETANSLGIGQKGLNNGVFLFIAPNDRQVQLGVGSGLEWALPDETTTTVVSAMMPYYGKRRFLEGALQGISLLEEKLGKAYVSVKDVSWEEVLTATEKFAGGVVRFRYPGNLKSGNCFRPKPQHAQFDKRFRLEWERGKHILPLYYTKYMDGYLARLCADGPLTVVARIDEVNPWELKLMGVLEDE
jgi:hypothetical protein